MKLFDFYFENPFATYWKVRKIFKRPKIEIHFSKCYRKYYPSILKIYTYDVSWKWKYNNICFEGCPCIKIAIFKRFTIDISSRYKNNYIVWETILSYLYDKGDKTLEDVIKGNTWINMNTGVEGDAREYIRNNI